ncbi:hypothetical protein [Pontibacterium sp.]|uniref:hypothetical protein n=1 Tax=Pontibacterium sp. TaxID=2036026 RepID=UPI003568D9C2
MNIHKMKVSGTKNMDSQKWVTFQGDSVFIDLPEECISPSDRSEVAFIRISEILPERYENANKGSLNSNDLIQIPADAKVVFVSETIADDRGRTVFSILSSSRSGCADAYGNDAEYATVRFDIDESGAIKEFSE